VISSKLPYSVSFVVSALNEEEAIEKVTREIEATVNDVLQTYEIILVDDGSTDRTGEIMDRLGRELPNTLVLHNRPNLGLGTAYWRGLGHAKHDFVMMLCGDGGLPAASLPAILAKVGTADIVVPYIVNLKAIKTPFRYWVSRTYTNLLNLLSGRRLQYYNGLPVHRRSLLNQITVTSSGFGIQGEIIIKLLKAGCTFTEVGVPGAELKHKSDALRVKNVVSVVKTIIKLVFEVSRSSQVDRS
jgi:dolichol-phosphate mannosyltransferase